MGEWIEPMFFNCPASSLVAIPNEIFQPTVKFRGQQYKYTHNKLINKYINDYWGDKGWTGET
jgi:hypothetical protein